jgi:DUF4097 and DUF4098 domain-containing protein YvlB
VPSFDTPDPVHARIELSAGTLRVLAGDSAETVVDVRPGDPRSSADVQAAQQTRVAYAAGTLRVTQPRRTRLLFFTAGPSVEVEVHLPAGSRLEVSSSAGDVDCEGPLGAVQVDSRYGDVRIDAATAVRARTSAGDIQLRTADGDVQASTSYGEIRIGSGHGDLRLENACGDITVDSAAASVSARTQYGQVRVLDAVRGSLRLESAYGNVEAGVREGTAAWLDVESSSGRVRNLLTSTEGPHGAAETLEITARTAHGNIVIRRA